MKKIISVIILLVLTATIAQAASINGDFKGNPIVKVKANGKELTVENTPAMIYNGNTLVPIYMLRQLGATVAWDAKTYSVDVSMSENSEMYKRKLEEVKLYNKIQNEYRRLEIIGDVLTNVADRYSTAYEGYRLGKRDNDTVNYGNTALNSAIDMYNSGVTIVNDMIVDVYSVQPSDTGMKEIMDIYLSAIDLYKLADNHYYDYINQNNSSSFELHLKYSHDAFLKAHEGIDMATKKYMDYYLLIDSIK